MRFNLGFEVCGGWFGNEEFLGNFRSQVFVVVYGSCGGFLDEVSVGL